jgi:hypothetical protein
MHCSCCGCIGGTGYRRNAGWVLPVGSLIGNGVMEVVRNDASIEDDAESWVNFFSGGTCAARTSDNGPRNTPDGKGGRWDPLCSQCKVRGGLGGGR